MCNNPWCSPDARPTPKCTYKYKYRLYSTSRIRNHLNHHSRNMNDESMQHYIYEDVFIISIQHCRACSIRKNHDHLLDGTGVPPPAEPRSFAVRGWAWWSQKSRRSQAKETAGDIARSEKRGHGPWRRSYGPARRGGVWWLVHWSVHLAHGRCQDSPSSAEY